MIRSEAGCSYSARYECGASRCRGENFADSGRTIALPDQLRACIMCGACYSECNAARNPVCWASCVGEAYRMVAERKWIETESRWGNV
jgi:succinate dehydrogenase/fumarate reductase-like Fe-S protein